MDLKQFLLDCGVKPEAVDIVLPQIGDAAPKITAKFDEIATKQTALDTATAALKASEDRLNQEMVEWAEAKNAGDPNAEQMRKDLAETKAEVTRLTTIVRTKAQELGLNADEIVKAPASSGPPASGTPATPDLSGYVRVDDVNTLLGQRDAYYMALPAELLAIGREHRALTGEDLDERAIMQEVRTRLTDKANRNPDGTLRKSADARQIWEEQHQIAAKRDAKAKADHDRQMQEAETRGYERARTEQLLPGETPAGRHSPALIASTGEKHQPKATRPGVGVSGVSARVQAGAAALRDGRYRGGAGSQK